jgi:uncharacterized protein (DUF1330 family)
MKTRYTASLAMLVGFGLGAVAAQYLHPPSDGRFIARGGRTYVVNGEPPKRVAIVQWQSFEKAKAFYESAEYKAVIPIRDKSSKFRAYVIEGVAK